MTHGPGRARALAWVDGASRGNPGESGFGAVVELDSETLELGGYLGRTTNNVAEYAGVLCALEEASRRGIEQLTLRSDSQLLVRQIQGIYKVKAPHLRPFFERVNALRRSIPRLEMVHVPREENRRADALANRAIDQRMPVPDWLTRLLGGLAI